MLTREEEANPKIYKAPPKRQYGCRVTSTARHRFMFNKLQVLAGVVGAAEGMVEGVCWFTRAHTSTRTRTRILHSVHFSCHSLSVPTLQFARLPRVWKKTELPLCPALKRLHVAVCDACMTTHSLSGVSRDKWKS